MRFFEQNLFSLIFGLIGAIFLILGLIFLWSGASLSQEARRIEALPVLTAASLQQAPPGQEAVLEGRLSERNPLQFQSFVAYIRTEYQGERCRRVNDDDDFASDDYECEAVWVEDERKTPALWLDVADGRVRLANVNYPIQNPSLVWQSSAQLIEKETKSYEGFKIGSPVFAKGKVTVVNDENNNEGPAFEAEFLYGGDRALYLVNQQAGADVFFWLGLIFGSIGGVLLVILLVKSILRVF